MNLDKLVQGESETLYQVIIDGKQLVVKETPQYRWFEYAGHSVQSIMNREVPDKIVSPVYQSLLIFLLLRTPPFSLLNLGLGGASIERKLVGIDQLSITSIEASQAIIDMAKSYFNLPSAVQVICQDAQQYITETAKQYDVILCDLFIGEKSPEFLFSQTFYRHLKAISCDQGVLVINLQADDEPRLLKALLVIKRYFPFIALLEFTDFINVIIIASTHSLPNKKQLQLRLNDFSTLNITDLQAVVDRLRYIP